MGDLAEMSLTSLVADDDVVCDDSLVGKITFSCKIGIKYGTGYYYDPFHTIGTQCCTEVVHLLLHQGDSSLSVHNKSNAYRAVH